MSVSIHCWQKVACPHGTKATLNARGALRHTSHDAEAETVTTVDVGEVVLMTGDCILSSTLSKSYSSVELRVSSGWLSGGVTLSQQWLTEHKNSFIVQLPLEYLATALRIRLSLNKFCFFFGLRSSAYRNLPVGLWCVIFVCILAALFSCLNCVIHSCRFLLAFSTPANCYLRFPYLHFPPLRMLLAFTCVFRTYVFQPPILAFSVLAFSVAPLNSLLSTSYRTCYKRYWHVVL